MDLSVLDHGRVTFLDQVVAPHMLRAVSAVGESFPAHSCAPGKAMMAGLSARALRDVLPGRLEALTPNTITTLGGLRRELKTVRERGYALDREEHTLGICAVGAAVVTGDGTPMAISVPDAHPALPRPRARGGRAAQTTCLRIPAELGVTAEVRTLLG